MAKKIVMAELRADVNGLRSDLMGAARMFEQLNSRIERMQTAQNAKGRGGKFDMVGGLRERFGGAMETAKAVAVGGAFYGAASEMKVIRDYEKALVDLAVSGGEGAAYLSKMREQVKRVSDAYGISKEDVLSFAQEIVTATGDTKLAASQLENVGRVAYASGAEMKDLAGVMVQLQNVAKIPMSEATTAFGMLIEQAQKGSFEVKDMAKLLPEVIGYMDTFGMSGQKALGHFTALLQVAKRGTGSSEEATVAVKRMFDMIMTKRGAIEKGLGIELKSGGKWKDVDVMMKLIASGIVAKGGGMIGTGKNAKDAEGWMASTFDVRGSKVMRQLVAQARNGWDTKMGNYETYQSLAGASGAGAVDKMYASRVSLSGTQDWSKSMNEFRNHMHQTLLPIVQKIASVMPQLASAGKFAADNLGALVTVLAASKLLSLTNAWSLAAAKAATTSAAAATSSAVVSTRMAAAGAALMGLGMALMVAWDLYKGKDSLLVKTTKKAGNVIGDAAYDALNPNEAAEIRNMSDASKRRLGGKAFDLALSRTRAGINMSSGYQTARISLQNAIERRSFLMGRSDSTHSMGLTGEYSDKGQILESQANVERSAANLRREFRGSFTGNEGTLIGRHLPKHALNMMIPELQQVTGGSDASAIRATQFREEEGNRLRKQTADGIVAVLGLLRDSFSIVPKASKGKTGSAPK